MAHRKAGGTAKNLRASKSKKLGLKRSDGQTVGAGEILVRQRGTKFIAGANVRRAGDDTLYASKAGAVKFLTRSKTRFDGKKRRAKVVEVN